MNLPDYVYYYCISIARDFFYSCPLYFFPILTPLFCPSSSVSLSYFILAVPMRECLGKHSCMRSQFPIAILNGTSSFLSVVQENINMPSGNYYVDRPVINNVSLLYILQKNDITKHVDHVLKKMFLFVKIFCQP